MLSYDVKIQLASDHLQKDNRAVFLCQTLIRILAEQKNDLTDQFHLLPVFTLDPICTSSSPHSTKIRCYFCCNNAAKSGSSQLPFI